MKKFLVFLIFLFPFCVKAYSASSYIAYDIENKMVLMGSNYDEQRLIASISKIMTT